jgi:hypothetical protein
MTKVISQSEYLQLAGLLALAQKHTRMLEDIAESAEQITGETDITTDATFCGYPVDELLDRLDIAVVRVAEVSHAN